MNVLKKFRLFKIIGLVLPALCFADALIEDQDTSLELIYIQQAKVAELSQNPNRLDTYLLKVSGSDKTLVYFSDKPDRVAGTLSLSQFVKGWQNNSSLQEDQPNAVISYVSFEPAIDAGVGADILQLSNPEYDAGTDTVTFTAKPLHEYEVTTGKFENLVIVYDGVGNQDN